MSSARFANTTDRTATSEQLRDVRARAWSYVFACHAKKEAAPESRPDDAERNLNDSASNHSNV
jgi:hypothetical protein